MVDYRAKPGQKDPHGEMTGAITINMILTMVPIIVWSFFIGPWIFDNRWMPTLAIAVGMAVLLPLVCLRLSQRIWSWFSSLSDGW